MGTIKDIRTAQYFLYTQNNGTRYYRYEVVIYTKVYSTVYIVILFSALVQYCILYMGHSLSKRFRTSDNQFFDKILASDVYNYPDYKSERWHCAKYL